MVYIDDLESMYHCIDNIPLSRCTANSSDDRRSSELVIVRVLWEVAWKTREKENSWNVNRG